MLVRDVMTPGPLICAPETSVAEAGRLMWEGDCGVLPVVRNDRAIGVVTDRDLFIALATRNARASDLTVGAVAYAPAVTCREHDDAHEALASMKANRVRRLPVVDDAGRLVGMVSLNDLLLAAGPQASLAEVQVVDALHAISEHPLPVAVPVAQVAIV